MKILLVSHFFPPIHTAGTEKRTLGYALELRKLGHHVQVVCAGDWETGARYWNGFRDEVYQGVPVRRVDLNWALAPDPNRYLYDNPLVERHMAAWLEEWQPDLVHVTSCLTLTASPIRAAKQRGLPVVFTLTDFWSICPKVNLVRGDQSLCDGRTTAAECLACLMHGSKAYRGLKSVLPEAGALQALAAMSKAPFISKRRGLRGMLLDVEERMRVLSGATGMADRLTAPSAALAEIIQRSGKAARPVQVIYSGHDLSWLASMPPRSPSDKVRFGFIGQVIPLKGLHRLVSAFQAAGLRGRAELKIFGDAAASPDYGARLRAQAGDDPEIAWLGKFAHEQLGSVLAQLDVLVVPSQWHENNPRVMQEAFAGQTPVLASNVGGISEFVRHEENGLLFQHDDDAALVEQLRRLALERGLVERLRAGIKPPRTIADEVCDLVEVYRALLPTQTRS